jgi:hypothetical protein
VTWPEQGRHNFGVVNESCQSRHRWVWLLRTSEVVRGRNHFLAVFAGDIGEQV